MFLSQCNLSGYVTWQGDIDIDENVLGEMLLQSAASVWERLFDCRGTGGPQKYKWASLCTITHSRLSWLVNGCTHNFKWFPTPDGGPLCLLTSITDGKLPFPTDCVWLRMWLAVSSPWQLFTNGNTFPSFQIEGIIYQLYPAPESFLQSFLGPNCVTPSKHLRNHSWNK